MDETPPADRWYYPADMPDGALHVRLWWHAHGVPHKLDAARIWDKRGARWRWYAVDEAGAIRMVPPAGRDGQGWADAPLCWQPINPARWLWPIGQTEPTPFPTHAVPHVVAINRQAFAAVEAAEAEERAEQRREGRGSEIPWWRDATRIRYEPPGEVSLEMAEGRLMRALACCGAINPTNLEPAVSSLLAGVVANSEIEFRAAEGYMPVFTPLARDHDDFTVAMAWFASLDSPEARAASKRRPWQLNRVQRVLHYRALDRLMSFSEIGRALQGRRKAPFTRQAVRQMYLDGIKAVWRAANAEPAQRRGQPMTADDLEHVAAVIAGVEARYGFRAWLAPSGRRIIISVDGGIGGGILHMPLESVDATVDQAVEDIGRLIEFGVKRFGVVH